MNPKRLSGIQNAMLTGRGKPSDHLLGSNLRGAEFATNKSIKESFDIHNGSFPSDPSPETIYSKGHVRIGNDVWVGDTVTILSGVEIGDGAVIGASSVVTRNVDPYEVVAGNPARLIRFRFSRDIVELLTQLNW